MIFTNYFSPTFGVFMQQGLKDLVVLEKVSLRETGPEGASYPYSLFDVPDDFVSPGNSQHRRCASWMPSGLPPPGHESKHHKEITDPRSQVSKVRRGEAPGTFPLTLN